MADELKISSSFWLRRLHSLSGVFPIGAFLLEHMFTNSFIVKGAEAYNDKIEFLQSIPYLVAVEIVFIFVPILFHAFYGFYIWRTGKVNLSSYPYTKNYLYVLQRWTGLITFAYILVHVYETRIMDALYDVEVDYARMQHIMSNPAMLWFYIIGLAAACFHFANGLWGFCVSWGITVGNKAQKYSSVIFAALGFAIFASGTNSLLHLVK